MSDEVNSLSIIEKADMTSFKQSMVKIGEFQKLVRENLKEGKDFGKIPGTSKPTLYKPGAEKILMLMGLQSTYEIIDSTRDWKEGFFQYQVRCTLQKGGMIITQGLGCCNSKERKYIKQDPFTIDNTILKMAKKRSQVDASLTVASLSEIFTQDLEDIPRGEGHTPQATRKQTDDPASQAQINLINSNIIASHLLKSDELKRITKLIEGGIGKHKASDIIGWWLGDKDKKIDGERTKREKAEKEAKAKAKKEVVNDVEDNPFIKDDGLEINDPNAPEIDAKEKPKKAHKVSKGSDFISDEDLGGVVEVAPGVKVAELDTF